MVSPASYIASGSPGSAATSEVIPGPALFPKSPASGGELTVDGNEFPASSRKLPLESNVTVSPPIVGGVAPCELTMLICKTDALAHEPVKSAPKFCENKKRFSRSARVAAWGLLVALSNVTVMMSSLPYTASLPSGSFATKEIIIGGSGRIIRLDSKKAPSEKGI